MDAREKVREAQFFLDRMKELERKLKAGEKRAAEFTYYLDAFLSSWTSVLEIIRYDFAEKYRVGITREMRITDQQFETAATVSKSMGDEGFSDFIDWLKGEENKLRNKNRTLFDKRKKIVHREFIHARRGYRVVAHTYAVNISGADSLTVEPWLQLGGPQPATESSGARIVQPQDEIQPDEDVVNQVPEKEPMFCFKENMNESVVDICEQGYMDMERLVAEAQMESWKRPPTIDPPSSYRHRNS